MKRILIVGVLLASLFLSLPVSAATEPVVDYEKGIVVSVAALPSAPQTKALVGERFRVRIRLTSGNEIGKEVETINQVTGNAAYDIHVAENDKIIVAISHDFGQTAYSISDFDRSDYIYYLVALFAFVLIALARVVGIKTVLVIAISLLIIFKLFIAQVLAGGWNLPVLTFLVCTLIAVITHVPISGLSRKTLAALLGSLGGVLIAALLSFAAIQLMHLSGLDSEEAIMLKAARLSQVDFQGILFSGMVFGALGAVMDVSISIASALTEVAAAHPEASRRYLFTAGMNVGRDIMGTMSNTLILAYVGSSLPLVLLIMSQPNISALKIFNLGLIATEITRALTGSIGLICSIPLTALLAAWLFHSTKSRA